METAMINKVGNPFVPAQLAGIPSVKFWCRTFPKLCVLSWCSGAAFTS